MYKLVALLTLSLKSPLAPYLLDAIIFSAELIYSGTLAQNSPVVSVATLDLNLVSRFVKTSLISA